MSDPYQAVILSPHLDDAVFSCGGLIQQLSSQGKVLVINIFTKYLDNSRATAYSMTNMRYEEEKAAADLLGYTSVNLGELDALFRGKRMIDIFKPLSAQDLKYLPVLKEKICTVLNGINTHRLYVPLGIGFHADHQLTFLSMVDSAFKQKIQFYEDAPYCYITHATQARLDCLNGTTWPSQLAVQRWLELANSYHHSGFVQRLRPKWIIPLSIPFTHYYLARLLQRHAAASLRIPLDTNPQIIDITKEALNKLKASQCYISQIKYLFSDDYFRRHAALCSNGSKYVERYWKLSEFEGKLAQVKRTAKEEQTLPEGFH